MGCWSGIAKFLLVIVNIVFLLLGLALTVVGFILRFGQAIYDPVLKFAKQDLKDALADTGLGQFDVDSVNIGDIFNSMSIGFIIGGLALMAIAFFGCCGACYKIDCLLWLYAIVIIVFIVCEAVALGLLYGKPDLIKDQVKTSLESYKGLASSETISFAWNIIMMKFECCGVDSYKDFDVATEWVKTPGSVSGLTLVTPVACCKTLPTGNSVNDFACATAAAPSSTLSNGDTGCFQTLWDKSFNNTAIAVPVLVICGIIQLAFIIFAIYIAKSGNDKVSPI